MAIKSKPQKAGLFGAAMANLSIILMSINIQAGDKEWTSEQEVTICIESGITGESGLAQKMAIGMFADIGVMVEFYEEGKCPAKEQGMIHIHLDTGVPAERFPGALAYAMPYEGIHIEMFADRIRKMIGPQKMHVLLAHVLVHEITHILQGVHRHSEKGIMKAKWEQEDFQKMCWKPLSFTEKDIKLIHLGLEMQRSKAKGDKISTENRAQETPTVK
jgi:hypothetical protein